MKYSKMHILVKVMDRLHLNFYSVLVMKTTYFSVRDSMVLYDAPTMMMLVLGAAIMVQVRDDPSFITMYIYRHALNWTLVTHKENYHADTDSYDHYTNN